MMSRLNHIERFKLPFYLTKERLRNRAVAEIRRLENENCGLRESVDRLRAENHGLFENLKAMRGGKLGNFYPRNTEPNMGELWLAVAGLDA